MTRRKSEKSWEILQQLDVSQPTRTRVTPLSEPEITPPPEPLIQPRHSQQEAPEIDPFELAKEKYRVNLPEILRWNISSNPEKEPLEDANHTLSLLFDNYYERVMVTGIPGLDLSLQTGEEQAMYFWFYKKSYGSGYSVCPMGQLELAHKLKWSRDRVKRHLASLIEKGHVKPLEEFPPFRNHRPQVYSIMLPREILRQKIDGIEWHDRHKAVRETLAGLREILGDF